MDIDLSHKRALVCGASDGLGLACAKELAELGCQVTLLSRSKERLIQAIGTLKNPEKHNSIECDLSNKSAVEELCQRLASEETIHILINNSGGPAPGMPTDSKQEDYESSFQAHLFAGMNLAKALIPKMKADGYGRIINITSVAAKQPVLNLPVSNTVRGAIAGWTKTLALEVAKDGITVNNILPGYTETNRLKELFTAAATKQGKSADDIAESVIDEIPMGRFGRPEEFGSVVAFLASPAASFVTGASIPVCGGWLRSVF